MKKILSAIMALAIITSLPFPSQAEIVTNDVANRITKLFYPDENFDYYFFCYYTSLSEMYSNIDYPIENAFGIKKGQIPSSGYMFVVTTKNEDLLLGILTKEIEIVATVSLRECNNYYKGFADFYKAVRPYWEDNTISVDLDIRVAFGDQMRALQNKGTTISMIFNHALNNMIECTGTLKANQWYYW